MHRALKPLHLVGLAVFLGSIPGHILLGRLADGAGEPGQVTLLLQAKHLATAALTLPGLAVVVISGAVMLARIQPLLRNGWMRARLGLVALIVVNSAFLLLPPGAGIAWLADAATRGDTVPGQLAALDRRETILGAVNLLMILAVVALSVVHPRRCPAAA